jgi:hypothetical protein
VLIAESSTLLLTEKQAAAGEALDGRRKQLVLSSWATALHGTLETGAARLKLEGRETDGAGSIGRGGRQCRSEDR